LFAFGDSSSPDYTTAIDVSDCKGDPAVVGAALQMCLTKKAALDALDHPYDQHCGGWGADSGGSHEVKRCVER